MLGLGSVPLNYAGLSNFVWDFLYGLILHHMLGIPFNLTPIIQQLCFNTFNVAACWSVNPDIHKLVNKGISTLIVNFLLL